VNPISLVNKYIAFWQNTGKLLWEAFGSYKRYLLTLTLLGVVANGLEAISINILIPLFSFFGEGKSATTDFVSRSVVSFFDYFKVPFTLINVLVLILILFMIKAAVLFIFGYLKDKIRNEYERNMADRLFSKTLSAKWPYLMKQKQGYLETVLTVDVLMTAATIETIASIIITVTAILMYFLVAVNISQSITAMTAVFAIITLLIFKPLISKARLISQESVKIQKEAIHHVSESVAGIKLIKILKTDGDVSTLGRSFFKEYEKLRNKASILKQLATIFIKPLSVVLASFILVFSYYYTSYNVGVLIAIVYLVHQIFNYGQNIQTSLHTLSTRTPYIRTVLDYKKKAAEEQETHVNDGKPFSFSNNIKFQDINFSYNPHKKILGGVSFAIPKGAVIGFIGASGAGKTTVFDLLTRLLEPDSGKILIDNVDIKEIKLSELRGAISYVSQDMFLLSTSIADNIRFYNNHITYEDMADAARQANILDFINSLPDKFNTVVGEKGIMLSVGQRQRIVIARALARKPQILLLDEATSALDPESESYIKEAISNLKGETTILIIAHKLSTLSEVNKIYVLEEGKITKKNSPKDLP